MSSRIVALIFVVLPLIGNAASPRTINWPDLLPPKTELADPLAGVDMAVRYDLGYVAKVLSDAEEGIISRDSGEYQNAVKLLNQLKEKGIDTDTLVTAVAQRDAELKRRNGALREDLNGELVRIPGYALPLEFSDRGVTEFLLVPYVGACIHAPVPPANQIVYVTAEKPFQLKGLYKPVWITGRVETQQGSRALSFVDGEADVVTGYSINAADIEPYK